MISFKKFFNWEQNDSITGDYDICSIIYNDNYIDKNVVGWDRITKNMDKNSFSNVINTILLEKSIKGYFVRLRNNRFSWIPEFIDKRETKRRSFLEQQEWKKIKFFGQFKIQKIIPFIELFADFPFKYQYQDIIISAIGSNLIIVISNHGNIWLISDDKKFLANTSKKFIKEGAAVNYPNMNY